MEETISLKEIFEVIKKRIGLIIAFVIGAALIAAVLSFFVLTPTYENSSQFLVNQENQGQGQQFTQTEIRTNIELINTYNVIITSPVILEDVAADLNLDMSSTELANKIQVQSAEQSQVVTVTATDEDPQLATDIANTTVQTFQNKIPDIMNVDNVTILSEAELGPNPSPVAPNSMLNIAIAIVLGGMIGVGLAFLLSYLDNTIKTEEDIEKLLEVPVLGVITHIEDKDIRMEQPRPFPNKARRREFDGTQKESV